MLSIGATAWPAWLTTCLCAGKGEGVAIRNASRAEGFNRHSASGFWRVRMVDKVLRSGKRKP